MSFTKKYRDQHEELLQMVGKIAPYLQESKVKESAEEISKMLIALTGKLKLHLAIEDEHLYPLLTKSNDPSVKNMAAQFMKEMGGIAKAYGDYRTKWALPQTMKAQPQEFIKDTLAVVKVLQDRISRENNQLYQIADKADAVKAA